MKPADLIRQLRKSAKPAAGYLFLGAEPFYRGRCRQELLKAIAGDGPDECEVARVELASQSLVELIDEARSMSLFSSRRLVIGLEAEQVALRAGKAKADQARELLAEYFQDPVEDAVVVIEAVRYDERDRDEKARLERVGKFFEAVPVRVDLAALSVSEAKYIGKVLAKRADLRLPESVLDDLVDMLGADGSRIENEIEKLAVSIGAERDVTRRDLDLLVPEARQSGVFEFSAAVAERDREKALGLLDTMLRAGMNLPMQLNLIAGLMRQALAVKQLGLSDPRQIGSRLGSFGMKVWPRRAQQLAGIARRFRTEELRDALVALFEADKALRFARPENRVIVETLVMRLTGRGGG